ncbi:hypothetical protein [Microbacterium sp. K24]|uniref:hypothetical protein n=1 Tax=Microbacterium sp. K24 TaxID=2305446 RepID=UPI00109C23AF|nr:hypothetical protein [Microbacterium sp. K24]
MEDEQWEKIRAARAPWASLMGNTTKEWVHWVQLLDVELKTWLHGEDIVYAEFGTTRKGEASHQGGAYEANELWAVVLTSRFVASVRVRKDFSTELADDVDVSVVPRSAIQALSLQVIDVPTSQGVPIVTRAHFEGLDDVVQFPAKADKWFLVDPEVRLAIFAGLRDDLHPQRC